MQQLCDTAYGMSSTPANVEVMFYIDFDDQPSIDCFHELKKKWDQVNAIIGPRIVLSEAWNAAGRHARFEILMQCGDDVRFRTKNWDLLVVEQFAKVSDRILFVFGRDGIQDGKIGTLGFVHRNWVDTIGYFVPPYFSCDFSDTWLTDVARRIKRARYLPELYTEHIHPTVGKAEPDQTHHERLARGVHDQVKKVYKKLAFKRRADARRLKEFIKNSARNSEMQPR
jgi:hypothetical protein